MIGQIEQKKTSLSSYLLISSIIVIAIIFALSMKISIKNVMKGYQYNILVILIVMQLFTNLIKSTNIMKYIGAKIALRSKGKKQFLLFFFGVSMFFISSLVNNITAVLVILPIIFYILKAIEPDEKYVCIFFASLLAISNTGGAATPIGDFPAVIIMTSGITTFLHYLVRAMPVFIITTIVLTVFWSLLTRKSEDFDIRPMTGILKSIKIDKLTLILLCCIFGVMFILWSFIPPDTIPPEIVAVLGYGLALAICAIRKNTIDTSIDFTVVLTIAGFLFMASIVSEAGWLDILANGLKENIANPVYLLLAVMVMTSIISGLFSAGPAAAAMMPIIINLSNTTLAEQSHWVAIAFAASICAGSSLFMWSASAGFILSHQIDKEDLGYSWGIGRYLKYGIVNYLIQITIAITIIALVL